MQGVSLRVVMLFVMIKAYFACKDTAFQRDTQLFSVFFRLLTEEHCFQTEGRKDRKSPRCSSYRRTREPDSSLTYRLLPKKCLT